MSPFCCQQFCPNRFAGGCRHCAVPRRRFLQKFIRRSHHCGSPIRNFYHNLAEVEVCSLSSAGAAGGVAVTVRLPVRCPLDSIRGIHHCLAPIRICPFESIRRIRHCAAPFAFVYLNPSGVSTTVWLPFAILHQNPSESGVWGSHHCGAPTRILPVESIRIHAKQCRIHQHQYRTGSWPE